MREDAGYRIKARPVLIQNTAGAIIARIECSECPEVGEWRISTRLPPADLLHAHFARKGWNVQRKPLCELCQAKKRKPKMTSSLPQRVATPPAPSSVVAREAKQLAFLAVQDYYDPARKTYKPGHTDASIAHETGCAEKVVAEIREEFFGQLGEPDEVKALRAEIAGLAGNLASAQRRFDDLAKRNGWVVS